MRNWRLMTIFLGLAGCAGAPAALTPERPAVPDRAARIVAECNLLAAADAATRAAGRVAPDDILVGCPGYEGRHDTMPLSAQTAALRRANRAVLPPAVAAAGPRAGVVYRRMITRGVPEDIARTVAQGELLTMAAK